MIVVMHLYFCSCVCNCMESICTFVKLQCILDIFIILLLFCYGEFSSEEMHMSFNFG